MSSLPPDEFGLSLWALYDSEKAARRTRPAAVDTLPADTAGEDAVVINDPEKYAAAALDRAVDDLALLVHGERNSGLNTAAFNLGRLVAADLLEYDAVVHTLDVVTADLWPDRDARNVMGTIHSGLAGGARNPFAWVQGERQVIEPATPFLVAVPDTTDGPALNAWSPVDLAAYLDGSHTPVLPSLLRRTDGVAALYPGRVHWLSGEPESLKSWLALLACSQALMAGESVLYLDLEDSPAGMVARLLDMGIEPAVIAAQFAYVSPSAPLTVDIRESLAPVVRGRALLVVDAATEALSMQGLTPKDDVDVARWLDLLPRWAAKLGPAVLVLDHVVKDADSRGRWATGSQHKLAGLDGIALLVEPVHPGGRGKTGRSRVFVAKDRHGHLGPHVVSTAGAKRWFADLVVDGSGSTPFLDIALHPPTVQDGEFRPTTLMTRVAEKLAAVGGPLTGTEIEDRVGGRANKVRQAVACLVDDGFVEVSRGPHNSKLHRLVKPYPDEALEAA